jgi:pimeloyl-ACP methyl ester carboxylesterase
MHTLTRAALLAVLPLHALAQAPPLPADPSPHRVRPVAVAPDARLEVLDWGGAGEAMVFLAGMGNSAHVFDEFAPRFTDRYRVLGITRRGFGGSSRPEGGYDSQTRAADVVAVLDSLGVARAVLVGHSLASDEMTRVAATYPERVRALVYLDAYDYGEEFRQMQAEMPEVPQEVPPAMSAADSASVQTFIAYRERLLGIRYPVGEALIHARFGTDGRFTGMVPRKEREVRQGLQAADLARVEAPALAIYVPIESVDRFFDGKYATFDAENQSAARHAFAVWSAWAGGARDRFRTRVRRPTVVLLRGGHHFLFLSHPDAVEREMRGFLARLPRRAEGRSPGAS